MSDFMVCTDVAEDELVMDLHELNQDHASNDEDVRDDEKVDDDMDTYKLNTEPNDNKTTEDSKLEELFPLSRKGQSYQNIRFQGSDGFISCKADVCKNKAYDESHATHHML